MWEGETDGRHRSASREVRIRSAVPTFLAADVAPLPVGTPCISAVFREPFITMPLKKQPYGDWEFEVRDSSGSSARPPGYCRRMHEKHVGRAAEAKPARPQNADPRLPSGGVHDYPVVASPGRQHSRQRHSCDGGCLWAGTSRTQKRQWRRAPSPMIA
jgi:hypothetical protein